MIRKESVFSPLSTLRRFCRRCDTKGMSMKKYQKQLLSLLAGAVLGYLLYYHFFMDVFC